MKLLAFDTSASACSVALLLEEEIFSVHENAPMQQTKLILPMIEKCLTDAKIKINELDAIAFGCGPGSFTGIRIAVSVAQGLAFPHQKPLISISSLAALAQSAYDTHGWKDILVLQDARLEEVFKAFYTVDDNNLVQLVGEEEVIKPENIAILNQKELAYGAGNGWEVYASQIQCHVKKMDSSIVPNAASMLKLAKAAFIQNKLINALSAEPHYLRNRIAKKLNEKNKE